MKKRWLVIMIPVFVCLMCIGYNLFVFRSNIGSHPNASIKNMLVDISDFPDGWKVDYVLPITGRDDWGTENLDLGVKLEPEQGFASQYVYRFHNIFEARYALNSLRSDLLLLRENKISFLDYKSPIADDWIMQCANTALNGIWCDTLARYDDFIIFVGISAANNKITPQQLEKILKSVDARMEKELMKTPN